MSKTNPLESPKSFKSQLNTWKTKHTRSPEDLVKWQRDITGGTQKGPMCNESIERPDFSGVCRSVECFDNQGHHQLRILTLYIEHGQVVKMDRSDCFENYEALERLEMANELSLRNLYNSWKEGRTLCK